MNLEAVPQGHGLLSVLWGHLLECEDSDAQIEVRTTLESYTEEVNIRDGFILLETFLPIDFDKNFTVTLMFHHADHGYAIGNTTKIFYYNKGTPIYNHGYYDDAIQFVSEYIYIFICIYTTCYETSTC